MNIKNRDLINKLINKDFFKETATFTGHRPHKLYGYDLRHPYYQVLAREIFKQCEFLLLNKEVKYFISGCALGADTVSFFAVEQLKRKYPNKDIKNILAIPYADLSKIWKSKTDIDRFDRMKASCDGYIEVDSIPKYNPWGYPIGEYNSKKLNSRNEFMVDYSSFIIAITLGEPSGTENCLNYLNKNRPEVYINRIHPEKILEIKENKEFISKLTFKLDDSLKRKFNI